MILDRIPKLRIAEFNLKLCSVLEKRLFGTNLVLDHSNLTQCPIKKVRSIPLIQDVTRH